MINELLFILQSVCVGTATLIALRLGAGALVALVCVQCVLANLFVLKQTTLLGLNATCADAFTIGATFALNVLQEYYGKRISRQAVWTNTFLLCLVVVVSWIHLQYLPSEYDTTQLHYVALLGFVPRIVIASFTVYFISQTIDYQLYGFLKARMGDRFVAVRNVCSASVSQLVDTVLFTFLGLYGIVDNLGDIILVSYTVKMVAIGLTTPFLFLARLIKR